MRVVGLAGHVVDPDLVERFQAVRVVDKTAVHAAVVVARGWLRDLLGLRPTLIVLPHLIDPLEGVGNPADLAFGVGDA